MLVELIKPHIKQKEIIRLCLDDDNKFIVAIIGRQFGKTTIAENIALYWAINEPNSTIYWVSPTDSQSQKVYKDIINAIYEGNIIKTKKMPKGDTEIVFINGSKILFRSAASEDNLRGQSVNYMILDEAAFIKRTTIEQILLPMLSVVGKKCLFISTPKGKNYLYDYYLNGQTKQGWKSVRYSTYDSPLANSEMIEMFRDTLPDKIFKQEVQAEFIDSSSIFNNITEVMVGEEVNNDTINSYYGGIDIGIINDASVFSVIDSEGNLVKYYRWEGIDTTTLMNNIKDISNKYNFKKIYIEDNNQGIVIYDQLRTSVKQLERFNTNTKTKPEIINKIIYLFNTKEIKLIKDEYLRIELEAFIFEQNNNGNIKFMASYGFNDDCVMSLAIARRCYDDNKYKNLGKFIKFY